MSRFPFCWRTETVSLPVQTVNPWDGFMSSQLVCRLVKCWYISDSAYFCNAYNYIDLAGKCLSISIKLYLKSRVIHRMLQSSLSFLQVCVYNEHHTAQLHDRTQTALHFNTVCAVQVTLMTPALVLSPLPDLHLKVSRDVFCVACFVFEDLLLMGNDSAKWHQEGSLIF